MSLLPSDASFEELVQDCFTAFRGRGVMLSALDAELLHAWAEKAVPFEVVARGIRNAASRLEYDARPDQGLRSLASCRRDVEKEIDKFLRTSIGRHLEVTDKPPKESLGALRLRKLRKALEKTAEAHAPLAGTLERLVPRLQPHEDLTRAERQEAAVIATLTRALPHPERLPLLREATRLVQNASPISAAARRESLRFFRAWLLQRHLDLPSFW